MLCIGQSKEKIGTVQVDKFSGKQKKVGIVAIFPTNWTIGNWTITFYRWTPSDLQTFALLQCADGF
jgi:hypothetical protein